LASSAAAALALRPMPVIIRSRSSSSARGAAVVLMMRLSTQNQIVAMYHNIPVDRAKYLSNLGAFAAHDGARFRCAVRHQPPAQLMAHTVDDAHHIAPFKRSVNAAHAGGQ